MTDYDDRARLTAARLLAPKAKGGKAQAVILTKTSGGTYNTTTSKVGGSVVSVQTGSGVVLEYSSFTRSGQQTIESSLIQSGDRKLLLSPLDQNGSPLNPPPGIKDAVTLASGKTYTITSVAKLSPAGTPIYYECNIRGAP